VSQSGFSHQRAPNPDRSPVGKKPVAYGLTLQNIRTLLSELSEADIQNIIAQGAATVGKDLIEIVQKIKEQRNRPHAQDLLNYKLGFQTIHKELAKVSIHKSDEAMLLKYREDLAGYSEEVKKLKSSLKPGEMLKSVDGVYGVIDEAIAELDAAIIMFQQLANVDISMAKKADSVRVFNQSILKCREYLEEAMQQFLI